MMKRIISFLILFSLLAALLPGMAEEVTLPVKMDRQLQNDQNGLKGSFVITTDADSAENPFLAAFGNAPFNILRNMSSDEWHLVVYQSDESENRVNTVELYRNDTGLFLSGSLLQGTVYQLPELSSLLESEIGTAYENPSIASAFLSLATMSSESRGSWDPVLEKYEKKLTEWINSYFSDPSTQTNGSVQSMILSCSIPPEDVKKQILSLVETAAGDEDLLRLLFPHMTEEQTQYYMNPALLHYYSDVIGSITLPGNIEFRKAVSALGETFSTEMVLPLDAAQTGYSRLRVVSENGLSSWTLSGEKQLWVFVLPENAGELLAQKEYDTVIQVAHADLTDPEKKDGNYALRLQISRTQENNTDENTGKEHEIQHYTVRALYDPSILPENVSEDLFNRFEPVDIECVLHYSGKPGPNSQTTLAVTASWTGSDLSFSVEGKVKTASTWPFVPFDPAGAVSWSSLDEDGQAAALSGILLNAAGSLIRVREADENDQGGTAE